jgi:hypothetical protein
VVAFERLTNEPGAADQKSIALGPAILSVESGILDVTLDDAAAAFPPPVAERDAGEPPTSRTRPIGPGETIVIPDGVAYSTANRSDAPAAVLLLTRRAAAKQPAQSGRGAPESPPAGIASQGLAGYTADIENASTVTVELARVTLVTGSLIATHEVGGMELVAVDAGTLTATFRGFGWLRDPAGHSTTSGQSAEVPEGDGLAVSGDGASASYRNESNRPVILLFLRLTSNERIETGRLRP